MPNQIDAGIAPIWNGSYGLPAAARPYISAVTTQVNAALIGLIATLESTPGFDADIVPVDAYGFIESVIANPAAYGLGNVTQPAFPARIGDAGQYLFWDPIHPTAVGHQLLASAALAAIPEPGVLPLVGVCLALLAVFPSVARRSSRNA